MLYILNPVVAATNTGDVFESDSNDSYYFLMSCLANEQLYRAMPAFDVSVKMLKHDIEKGFSPGDVFNVSGDIESVIVMNVGVDPAMDTDTLKQFSKDIVSLLGGDIAVALKDVKDVPGASLVMDSLKSEIDIELLSVEELKTKLSSVKGS
ncbi:MAG: hypothetical protein GY774_00980 [Planctomycetes bacterium]|nr:hypothetical protein [Planctomycetota bacterium]|tara:strand:- start:24357 stop:24809 length:453 start_codon:yes stop_codon:yes gene_type:complete